MFFRIVLVWLFVSNFSFAYEELALLPRFPPIPADNPQSAEKIHLGKQLFFDQRISEPQTFSCATCHNVMSSGENNLRFSQKPDGTFSRHAVPTVWNSAYLNSFFWGGGASSLEEQSEGPLEEMGLGDTARVVKRVAAIPYYATTFKTIFVDEPVPLNLKNLTKALAAYERTLITPDSAFDRNKLNAEEKSGLSLFKSVGCINCHGGAMFTSDTLQAFPVYPGSNYETKYKLNLEPDHKWKVPTLRNIELTAPYFHNGSVGSLDEAVRVMAKTQLNKDLVEGDVKKLSAFLKTLTGKQPIQLLPRLPKLAD